MLSPAHAVTSPEKRLIKHLLANYATIGVDGRPVFNYSETVRVNFGVGLISIEDVNEAKQQITLNVWLRFVSQPYIASSSSQDEPIDRHSTQNRRNVRFIIDANSCQILTFLIYDNICVFF